MGLDLATSFLFFLVSCIFELFFILLPLIIFKIQKKDLKKEFFVHSFPQKKKREQRILDVILGLTLGVGLFFLGELIWRLILLIIKAKFGEVFLQTAEAGSVNVSPPILVWYELLISIILMYCLVGFAEEFCFRGVIFKEIKEKNQIIAYLLSSMIFSLYHVFPGIVPIQTFVSFWFYYFIMGFLLALIMNFQKGDILSSIIAHGTVNAILFIITYT